MTLEKKNKDSNSKLTTTITTSMFPFLYTPLSHRLKSTLPAPFSKLFFTTTTATTNNRELLSSPPAAVRLLDQQKEQDYTEFRVKHDEDICMFFIQLDSQGTTAAICYLPTIKKNAIEIYHIEIPISYRNIGLGDKLVKNCLDWAKESGIKIIPNCPFVRRYLDHYKKDIHLLYKDIIYDPSTHAIPNDSNFKLTIQKSNKS